MSDSLIPGTTTVYPNPKYQGYTSPTDELILNVAYLVDPDFRHIIRKQPPDVVHDDIFPTLDPHYESFYADMAKKKLGISFGTEYKFPEGLNARTFQQSFLKCISSAHLRDNTTTETERKNLEQSFSLLEKLNPEEFKKLNVGDLSEWEKFEVVMGVCSKFTMNDIQHFIRSNRTDQSHEFISGAQFVVSNETKSKLENFLNQHNTSLAYLSNYIFPEWSKVPEQDIRIRGLQDHPYSTIKSEIRQHPDRFFEILKNCSAPLPYAERYLSIFSKSDQKEDKAIYQRLFGIRKALKNGDTFVRKGLSKILDLTQKLPPTTGRKRFKEALVKGYRFLYPKPDPDR